MEVEQVVERNERLGAKSQRQEQIAAVLAGLETLRGKEAEGTVEALRVLLVDAVMDQDDYALSHAVDGLHRVYISLRGDRNADAEAAEMRGELRGLHNVASVALERMVPLRMLAEIAPDTLVHKVLAHVVEHPGCSNDDLVRQLETDKTQVSRAGRRLIDAGMARKRRMGSRNAWQPTPRGIRALSAVQAGWVRPAGRQRSHA
jgi:hypothetical protein